MILTASNECLNKPCGELCSVGICNGNGRCVDVIENPCEVQGCEGKKCGEDCLSGDILGVCDASGINPELNQVYHHDTWLQVCNEFLTKNSPSRLRNPSSGFQNGNFFIGYSETKSVFMSALHSFWNLVSVLTMLVLPHFTLWKCNYEVNDPPLNINWPWVSPLILIPCCQN